MHSSTKGLIDCVLIICELILVTYQIFYVYCMQLEYINLYDDIYIYMKFKMLLF